MQRTNAPQSPARFAARSTLAIVGALTAVVSGVLFGACTSFTGNDSSSSGQNAEGGSGQSPGDASDELPPVMGGSRDASDAGLFCVLSPTRVCDDFDEASMDLDARWTQTGVVRKEGSPVVSGIESMSATTGTKGSGASIAASRSTVMGHVLVDFDFRWSSGSTCQVVTVLNKAGTEVGSLTITPGMGFTLSQSKATDMTVGSASVAAPSTWQHVTLALRYGAGAGGEVSVDNSQTTLSQSSADAESSLTVQIGASTKDGTECAVFYDNVDIHFE
jgi:hypothetical protein